MQDINFITINCPASCTVFHVDKGNKVLVYLAGKTEKSVRLPYNFSYTGLLGWEKSLAEGAKKRKVTVFIDEREWFEPELPNFELFDLIEYP